ncbi:MAG: energy transducer TonB [Flavobacteriales bacterium]|nr:energy transducer TonB [Flavobacteriales bacterium]
MVRKNHPYYRLEKKRGTFLAIGMACSLFFVLTAMEWTTERRTPIPLEIPFDHLDDDDIDIVITTRKKKKVAPPKLPPQVVINPEPVLDPEPEPEPEPEPDPDPEPDFTPDLPGEPEIFNEPDIPFKIVEDMPQFGHGDLLNYIQKRVRYPKMASGAGVQGTVYVSFVVNKKGEVVDVKVIRGIGSGCDREALRVIKSLPQWEPGKQRGKAVSVEFTLPVRYKLR